MATTKSELDGNHPSSHYLVVEDPESTTTWHLRVRNVAGEIDHRLMGAAWAALHGGYRGNKYEGPQKGDAIDKLKKLYASEEMQVPTEKMGRRNSMTDQERINKILMLVKELGGQGDDEEEDDKELEIEMKSSGLITYKGRDGRTRWLSISSSAYLDRDGEGIPLSVLEADVERSKKDGYYGPLRWRHIGEMDVTTQKAGPGLDIGDCDFSTMWEKLLVEGGTFRSEEIATKISRSGPYDVSLGFFRPKAETQQPGRVYSKIKRVERSLLPPGRASNLFTSFDTIGGVNMATKEQAYADLVEAIGPDLAGEVSKAINEKAQKAEESGVPSFKERITEIFASLKGEKKEPEQPATATKAKTIADLTPEEFKAMLQPAPAVATTKKEEDTVAAVKEATAATVKRVDAIEKSLADMSGTMKALLDELESLAGKPGYRPTKDAQSVVKTAQEGSGIAPDVHAFISGGG